MLEWTGERFLPWIEGVQIHYEHLHRYAFAARFVKGKKVLDLGCGEGYGTYMLAKEATYVAGVEIDKPTVQHARSKYIKDNLEFIEGSVLTIPIEGEKEFDIVVCFELIEHIAEHDKLLSEVKRLLKDDGLFIVSTPNKAVYTDAPDHHNPFHVKELYFKEFRSLLRRYFKHLRIFGQRIYAGSNMWSIHQHKSRGYIEAVVKKGDMEFYFTERASKEPVYLIALASNASLKPSPSVTDSWLTDISNAFFKDYERRLAELNQTRLSKINSLETSLQKLEYQINQIQHSIPMQLMYRYQRIVDKLMRPGTHRRRYYELGPTGIRVILNEGWRSFFRQTYRKALEKLLPPGTRRRYWCQIVLAGIRVIRNEGWRSFFRKALHWLAHRPAAIKRPRYELPKFNASILKKEADELVFPVPSKKPEVSIIIPAYNKWKYTLNCLKSIAENTDGDYEVVVVDDASSDATVEVLTNVKNLNLVINKHNAGFLESCNRGARASKGKAILFLNNDTMASKGWLPPLLEVIRREDIGAVGSKLVYPDGTLQEAGGIIWNDGSGWNYGRGDDPGKPEYNYVRDVDYCSGAIFMVKRELFEKIGGFDERFKPAYYEDSDLCFAIRNLGYRVMYQPMTIIAHFEGVSCGTDTSSGIKKYQEINKPKFVEKWSPVLQEQQYPHDAENAFLARDRVPGKRILVIDSYVPTYDKDAGSLDMFSMLKILVELGNKVTFLGDNLRRLEPYTQGLQQKGIEVIYAPYVISVEDYIKKCGRFFDLVILSRAHIAIKHFASIKRYCVRAKVAYDTVDLHYLRQSRQASIENNEKLLKQAEETKVTELYLAKNSDITFVVSPVEKEILLKEDPSLNVEVIIRSVHSVTTPQKSFLERKDILFIGGFDHLPNVDAVVYFVKEIFPLIKQRMPDVHFYIVGSNPSKDVLSLQSDEVIVTGYVEDVAPYFENCKIFVAPLRYGAGVKGKILLSMSYGVPVVTTSIGSEGIGLVDGQNVLIADDPQEFAQKAILLWNEEELWDKLSRNSLEHISKCFSYETAREQFKELMKNL
jgi:GT2 family glycosyltransferase/glycosyltransferase involved in cell wall biosynthesis/ubiquinone/menaquinone biosynthesis C-methylase UbiE